MKAAILLLTLLFLLFSCQATTQHADNSVDCTSSADYCFIFTPEKIIVTTKNEPLQAWEFNKQTR